MRGHDTMPGLVCVCVCVESNMFVHKYATCACWGQRLVLQIVDYGLSFASGSISVPSGHWSFWFYPSGASHVQMDRCTWLYPALMWVPKIRIQEFMLTILHKQLSYLFRAVFFSCWAEIILLPSLESAEFLSAIWELVPYLDWSVSEGGCVKRAEFKISVGWWEQDLRIY